MIRVVIVKEQGSIGAHIVVGIAHPLNTRISSDQFSKMQVRVVVEKHIPCRKPSVVVRFSVWMSCDLIILEMARVSLAYRKYPAIPPRTFI